MLRVYDKNHNAIGHIVKYKDLKIEGDLTDGNKTLSFIYLAKYHTIEPEYYIETQDDEYVVKEKTANSEGFLEYVCVLNLEELEGKPWSSFSVTDKTIDEAARLALAGTGWTVGECVVTKRRNAGMLQVNSKEIIDKLCAAFICERVYDTRNKTVSFYDKIGEDKGVYFLKGLNLKKITKKSDSYDYYTRIIPIGSNGLTIEEVNGGKNYLENYQYSNKVKSYIWQDDSYTDPQAMMEDAELKLEDLSKPVSAYSGEVIDLAKQNPAYSILSYKLGDTVTLIDAGTRIREKQRIVKLIEYPQDPSRNTCELANATMTFEELQQKYQAAADIINTVVAGDGRYTGTISVSDILHFEQGIAGSSTVAGLQAGVNSLTGELAQVKLSVGQIETNYLKADEAYLKYATIEQLNATNETVHTIQGDYASFKSTVTDELSAHVGLIDNIQGDLASYKTVVAGELVAAKGWMAEGAIGNAQISNVSANKLGAGTIDTAIVTVAGTDGRLRISDNTIQIKDANRVRVQIGKDASGDYSMSVWDASGKLIWDALGATEDTIQRKIIRDKMVADDAAIQALKIDFQSFDTALTQQGVTISGTVVQVGSKTLNVALSEQTQAITSNYTELKGYTDSAKTEAISTAASDATTKANNAKEAAISTAASDAKTKAEKALADAKSYADAGIAGLVFDGQNLAAGTSPEWESGNVTDITNSCQAVFALTGMNNKGLQEGDIIQVGVDLKFSPDFAATGTGTKASYIQGNCNYGGTWASISITGGGQQANIEKIIASTSKTGRITTYFKVTKAMIDGTYSGKWIFNIRFNYYKGTVYWRNQMVNKGSKPLLWQPAPEDILSEINLTNAAVATHTETLSTHEARITANESAIKLKVSTQDFNSYKTTVTGAISTAKTEAISAAASDATTKADKALADAKTYTTAQITTVNEHLSTTDQEISVMKGQIALKVEQVDIDTAVSQMEIGGRNLVANSSGISVTRNNTAKTWISEKVPIFKNTDYGFALIQAGGKFTISFDYEITGITTACSMIISLKYTSSSYGTLARLPLTVGDNTGHFEYTFTPTEGMRQYGTGWLLSGFGVGQNQGAVITLRNIMLEKGTKATDWTPAPEDIDSSITAVDNKFSKYSTTTQMQAAITAAKDSITSAVSQTYATKSEVSTVSGKVTSLETWKTEASQKITKDGIIQTVGNYYAYESDLTKAESRITTAESRITQQAEQISLRVEKAGVISAINQTAEAVKIDASKINLSGYVTMTNLATSGQTAINGGNITTGLISADRIDVNGLFAKDITATGTIRGVKLIGGSITTTYNNGTENSDLVISNGTFRINHIVGYGSLDGKFETYEVATILGGDNTYEARLVMSESLNAKGDPIGQNQYRMRLSPTNFSLTYKKSTSFDSDFYFNVLLRENGIGIGENMFATNLPTRIGNSVSVEGGIQLSNTGGSWLHGMTETKCLVGSPYTSAAGETYHPIIRQNTALGNVFNLGGMTASSTDDRFGVYIFRSGRTDNGYDYATYWNAINGKLTHEKDMAVKGTLTCEGGNISTSANGYRIAYGNYGFFIRNDGTNTYFMLTNSGDQYGTWNSFRPIIIENATGTVKINNQRVMAARLVNGYWGLCTPESDDGPWIRTTTAGIIPYQSGGATAGHCSLGTSSWYFQSAYIQTIYEGGTALSSKYAAGSHTHDIVKSGTHNWICSTNGNWVPRTNTTDTPHNVGNSNGYVANLYYQNQTKVSDRRRKIDQGDLTMEEANTILWGSKAKRFLYRATPEDGVQYGLYAQDFRDLLISSGIGYVSALRINKQDEEDTPVRDIHYPEDLVHYGLDYQQFTPILIKGWQGHDRRLETCENRIFEISAKAVEREAGTLSQIAQLKAEMAAYKQQTEAKLLEMAARLQQLQASA